MTATEYQEMLRTALEQIRDRSSHLAYQQNGEGDYGIGVTDGLRLTLHIAEAALATPPPSNKLRDMSEYKGDAPILRKHYAYGLMTVAPNRHINKEAFPWMNVSYENTWPEEAFVGGWLPLPEVSE